MAVAKHSPDRTTARAPTAEHEDKHVQYVTAWVADQLFGIPIADVRDVFIIQSMTPVPLAPPQILGLVNLRGRVVTAISLRWQLGLPEPADRQRMIAIGIESDGESYGVIVDRIGEVLNLMPDTAAPTPFHLDSRWAGMSAGVHSLDDCLLVILNVSSVLAFSNDITAR
ncbi:chemotaxis protein CheW [Chelatococcus asaccharovorans]|uniref:Purine-binding chemotaxis protein CheW n=1 Tax=Chelatococcus asaccharovorans TaxID=28210 RepID=A0A2V3UAT0_9HYPH|nr:chemotaxis protein CheW [Chelatococcus asaccharovorans]MBS7705232.1 chemotaxis protein CheW [Chelatococcus asaccharovorans]PXW60364.1 purine-binding chemotaxis protein CheW [Chelatococcus asaccharovorans]CAH1654041.1 Positive regulator of CheA protein activity (CheW) [Chelatococcus asaccharovorans]CAH1685863.1 Positive regulator of CheA protein activity (CheW) [Chelatococcus asaccharovorans]